MKLLKSVSITLLSASLLTLSFCKEDPIAPPSTCFSVENPIAVQGDSVIFDNCSLEANSYAWDFGDSTDIVREKNPTHVYATSGIFEVTLTTTNDGGSTKKMDVVEMIEKIPVKMTMTKLVIRKWPAQNAQFNVPWDNDNTGPDLFYYLVHNGANEIMAGEWKEDCVMGTDYSFEADFPFEITSINGTYKFDFYDFESPGLFELMGGMSFVPMDVHDDGIDVVHMTSVNWDFDIHVTWEY